MCFGKVGNEWEWVFYGGELKDRVDNWELNIGLLNLEIIWSWKE